MHPVNQSHQFPKTSEQVSYISNLYKASDYIDRNHYLLRYMMADGHKLPPGFSVVQSEQAIHAILAYVEKTKQNTLFEDAPVRINMDVTAFKIPEGLKNITAISLPHSPYPPEADILLVIPDDKRNKTEPEQLVNRMKDKLCEFSITNIREVMTLTQLKNDFSTYEAKRALAKRVDVIIAMSSIFPLLPPILGREFYKKKKVALKIILENEGKWDEVFEQILNKTIFNISLKGQTSTLLVGHTNLSKEQLSQNVSKIVNWLLRLYPGKWKNVSQVSLRTAGIPPLMIYLSEGSKNAVRRAMTSGHTLNEPVKGELSTYPGGRIKIGPFGDIKVSKASDSESDLETA